MELTGDRPYSSYSDYNHYPKGMGAEAEAEGMAE
jgi:hypothetical protein